MTLPLRPPLIVHHMGALDDSPFPPNSLEVIRTSLDYGAQFIELDITALAEADYLLVHEPELASETTGSGPVADCTPQQASQLFYQRKGAATPYHAARLSQVVALLVEHPNKADVQLDFKNVLPFTSDEPLERLVRLIEPLGDRVIVSTGADWQLRRLRRIAPDLRLGLDIHYYLDLVNPAYPSNPQIFPQTVGAYGYYDDYPLAWKRIWSTSDYLADRLEMLAALVPSVHTFYISHPFLAKSLDDGFNWAEALHRLGIRCSTWTLDVGKPAAEANAPRLLAAGVDQFTTNTPIALKALLGV